MDAIIRTIQTIRWMELTEAQRAVAAVMLHRDDHATLVEWSRRYGISVEHLHDWNQRGQFGVLVEQVQVEPTGGQSDDQSQDTGDDFAGAQTWRFKGQDGKDYFFAQNVSKATLDRAKQGGAEQQNLTIPGMDRPMRAYVYELDGVVYILALPQ